MRPKRGRKLFTLEAVWVYFIDNDKTCAPNGDGNLPEGPKDDAV